MKRPTITDLAEHSGVSRTTVSLVLRDADRIPESTKARVRASMEALGYVYNRAGAAVRAGRSSLLGLLLTDVRNPFFAEITMALDQAISSRGMSVLQSYSLADPVREARTARSLAEHFPAGLILLPTSDSQAAALSFLPPAQPLVQLIREVPGLDSDYVGVDNHASGVLLGTHLRERGLTRVLLVGDRASVQLTDRRDGLSRALGSEVAVVLGGADGLARVLGPGTLDCIVTYNDTHMLAVLGVLRRAGLAPGADIGVASFDNTALASLVVPEVTSVDHHVSVLAEESVRLVLARNEHPEAAFERSLVAPTLVVRASTSGVRHER